VRLKYGGITGATARVCQVYNSVKLKSGGKKMGKYEVVGPYIRRKKNVKETGPKEKGLSPIEELVEAEKRGIIEGKRRKIN